MGPTPVLVTAGPQGAHYSPARGISGPSHQNLRLPYPYATPGAMTAGRGARRIRGMPPGAYKNGFQQASCMHARVSGA